MFKGLPLFLTGFLFLYNVAIAQIVPPAGAKLNYTQIMFEHPQVTGAASYLLEVSLYPEDSSFKQPVVRREDSSSAVIIHNLAFGRKYVWRYAGFFKGRTPEWKGPCRFEILTDAAIDKNLFRVRILQTDSSVNYDDLIVLDMARTIIDRNGDPVWFLPADTGLLSQQPEQVPPAITDLRLTPSGTVTLLNGNIAEERDLVGNLLWKAPVPVAAVNSSANIGIPTPGYSHCFKKLANGHYMVIDGVINFVPTTTAGITGRADNGTAVDPAKVMLASEILKEFDRDGILVWSWSAEKYFDTEELKAMELSTPDKGVLSPIPGGHMNAFDVDEKNGFVYAGFRNVSRVIKIDKKSGAVVCAWGAGMSYNGAKNGDGFFVKQHETTLLRDGSIAVFNNNILFNGGAGPLPKPNNQNSLLRSPLAAGPSTPSSVVVFSQPSDSAPGRLISKFDCLLDPVHNKSLRGGSVIELKNGNLLVCMGTINRVFEITRSNRIVWSSVIEKLEANNNSWMPFSLYRANHTSSLYPCYFTIQTSADTLKKANCSFQLRVFNDGTENDSYSITVSSSVGNYKKQLATAVMKGHTSVSFEIAPDQRPGGKEKIEISVQSAANPDLKRTGYISYMP